MLKLVKQIKQPEVNWQHPLIGGNPFMMMFSLQMAAAKTIMEAHQKKVEAHQKKVIDFMTTGVW